MWLWNIPFFHNSKITVMRARIPEDVQKTGPVDSLQPWLWFSCIIFADLIKVVELLQLMSLSCPNSIISAILAYSCMALIRSWQYVTQLFKQAQRQQYLEGTLEASWSQHAEAALARIISNLRLNTEERKAWFDWSWHFDHRSGKAGRPVRLCV